MLQSPTVEDVRSIDIRLPGPAPRNRLGRAARAARLFQLVHEDDGAAAREEEHRIVIASLARWR